MTPPVTYSPPKRSLRVVHVAMQLETGGLERLLAEVARWSDRGRVDLHFICLGDDGPVGRDIRAIGWPVSVLNLTPGVKPLAITRLRRIFLTLRPDVVHTHNTKPLLYAAPAARLASVPAVVHTRHGQRHGSTAMQNALFRAAGRCADRMVCVSADAAALCAREGINSDRLRIIHNGIDCDRFAPGPRQSDGPVVFVGRLSPEKDLATLLSAMTLLRKARRELVIAGAGPLEADLKQLAASNGLSGRVRFAGLVSDTPSVLRSASVFVLPSRTEGLPLTVLEAMACGVPVVATRVGGTSEVVAEGVTGLLVKPGDAAALAAAIDRILADPDLAAAMSREARHRAASRFGIRAMLERYESLYSEVLAEAAA